VPAIDAYLRRDDTLPALLLLKMSPSSGSVYAFSAVKRTLDLLVAVPALLFAAIPLLMLLAINRLLRPGHPALFRQDRVGRDGQIRVLKVRSLLPGLPDARKPPAAGTPRLTRFGALIRRWYLDELPQLTQVLTGRLSIVGIRVLPVEVYENLRGRWSHDRFAAWERAYKSSSLGLTGIHQLWRKKGKDDERRFRRDAFYARRASLGFDLYLIWRTFVRSGR